MNSQSANISPKSTINTSQSSNGKTNTNIAKANSEETEDPSTPVR
jgi:hypothetical protein